MDAILKTRMGKYYIQFSDNGLSLLSFDIPSKCINDGEKTIFAKDVQKQLDEYFTGKRKKFELLLDLKGTSFQMKVWKELSKISYAKTLSYGEISKKINLPKGARAIGGANNKNPLPIIIPCHRVIQSDGKLGGYAGGIVLKQQLLDLEQKNI